MAQQSIEKLIQTFGQYGSYEELVEAARAWEIQKRFSFFKESFHHKYRYLEFPLQFALASGGLGVFIACVINTTSGDTSTYAVSVEKAAEWMLLFLLGLLVLVVATFQLAPHAMWFLQQVKQRQSPCELDEYAADKILPKFLLGQFTDLREAILGDGSDLRCLQKNLSRQHGEASALQTEVVRSVMLANHEDQRAELLTERDELARIIVRTRDAAQRLSSYMTDLHAFFEARRAYLLGVASSQSVLQRSRQFRQRADGTLETFDDTVTKSLRVFAGQLAVLQNVEVLSEPQKMFLDREALAADLDTFERVADTAFALEAPPAHVRSC